MTLPLTP